MRRLGDLGGVSRPTMSEQADCWDMGNTPRADCYGR